MVAAASPHKTFEISSGSYLFKMETEDIYRVKLTSFYNVSTKNSSFNDDFRYVMCSCAHISLKRA